MTSTSTAWLLTAWLPHSHTVDGDHQQESHKHLPAKGKPQVDTLEAGIMVRAVGG